jgi:hypothetical protein
MEIEIALYFAAFLAQQVREKEARAKSTAEPGQESSPGRGAERRGSVTEVRQKPSPDLDVAILDRRETGVHVPLLQIGFDAGQRAIEKRGVRLVLPVMLERVNVRRRSCRHG